MSYFRLLDASTTTPKHHRRRRRHRVVVDDRSVAPVWPRWMAAQHRSAGGRWWSWRSWSIQWLRGRPELRPNHGQVVYRVMSRPVVATRNAWWAGMLGDILATCPKMASRRLLMLSITERRPVCAATSSLRTWSCQRMRRICRWHFISSTVRYGNCLSNAMPQSFNPLTPWPQPLYPFTLPH